MNFYFVIFAILIAKSASEIPIPNSYLNAKSVGENFKLSEGDVKIEKSILGGVNIENADVPYFALSYMQLTFNNDVYQCGGSLIKPNFVLTAAICLEERFKHLNTFLGIIQRNMDNTNHSKTASWESGAIAKSSQFSHPNYNPLTFYNDIALYKIPLTEARLSSFANVAIIQLPSVNDQNLTYVGEWGKSSGFGFHESGFFSSQLKSAQLQVMTNDQCRTFPQITNLITENNICTLNTNATVCPGDGGGPFEINNRIVGIVTFTITNCYAQYPGTFTRVVNYLDWIEGILKDNPPETDSAPASIKLSFFSLAFVVVIALIK